MKVLSKIDCNLRIGNPIVNPVFGEINSLSCQENGNNLVEIKIQEHNSGDLYAFPAFQWQKT